MHQSFATKPPSGQGNSGKFTFLFPKPRFMPTLRGHSYNHSSSGNPAQISAEKKEIFMAILGME